MAVEDREQADQCARRGHRQLPLECHCQAQHYHRQRDPGLDERQLDAVHAHEAANGHHGDEGRRHDPERAATQARGESADRHHGEDVIEAGRAQAIAARSYTLFYRGRRAEEGFDLYGTVEDQLYVGVEGERPLASRCVTSTAGEVALSDGRPVRANYCSTCGGITAEVWEAWPADPLAYLVSHRDRPKRAGKGTADDYCSTSKHFRWQEEWPAAELLANLVEYGPTYGVPLPSRRLGAITHARVESRSRSGRVWRMVVETSAGPVVIPAWSLRQVLRRPGNPRAILRSNLFKVDVRRAPRTDRVVSVVASGAGSGHGVGLCQTGALGMARLGIKAEEILRHYYRGAEIKRLY